MTDMQTFPIISDDGRMSQGEIRKAIMRELQLYAGRLEPLMGTVVPRLEGFMGSLQSEDGGREVWLAVFSDSGEVMHTDLRFAPYFR